MERIILDTDIGSDIDDAFALSYLLNQDNCFLEGITTCTGETLKRASLCDKYLEISGKKIEIVAGIEKPICGDLLQPFCPQATILENIGTYRRDVVEFLHNKIKKYPKEITLVCIGPLTNIAVLIISYPEIIKLVKTVVIMGGKIDTTLNKAYQLDWNFICDPIAAKVVLEADFDDVVIFPCDTTYQLNSNQAYMHEKLKGKYKTIIEDMSKYWFNDFECYSYHDPLTAMYVFRKDIFEGRRGKMNVEIKMNQYLGITNWENLNKGNHFVITNYNKNEFIEELYKTINK